MLENQSFVAEPLVVVGPEIFAGSYKAGESYHFNFDNVFRIRNHIQGFVFVYAALADSPRFGDQRRFSESLLRLGAPLRTITVVESSSLDEKLDDPELRKNLGSLLLNADLVYSPEFVEWFQKQGGVFSNRRNYSHDAGKFIDCLSEFSTSAVPFSQNNFFVRYSQLIGAI